MQNEKNLRIIVILITLFFTINFVYDLLLLVFDLRNLQVLALSSDTNINLEVTGVPSVSQILPSVGGALFIQDIIPPFVYDISIFKITLNSAEISWKTNELGFCQLFLGEKMEYEIKTISETTFYLNHATELQELSPATTYHFKISCQDTNQNSGQTSDQKFTTLFPPDNTAPANILNFESIAGDTKIELKWKNPSDSDFKAVRIMRSENFYPPDPWTGFPVYDGKEEFLADKGLNNGTRYYYTAFAYDEAGNYSSGAIVSAVPQKPGALPVVPPPEMIPPTVPPPPEIEKLNLSDFNFIQGQKKLPVVDGKIKLESKEPLEVSLDYEKVPEVLKTIMVTLEKDGKKFSFLLRINQEKTTYGAKIYPPDPGTYLLTLTILDYKNQTLKNITGYLIVEGAATIAVPSFQKIKIYLYLLLIILLLILATLVYLLLKKKREKERLKNNLNRRFVPENAPQI